MEVIRCCICSKMIKAKESNNPWPVRPWSAIGSTENRCCQSCNDNIVTPIRIGTIGVSEEQMKIYHEKFVKMDFYELDTLVVNSGLPRIEHK